MAESKKESKGGRKHVLLEYNCPIIHIAERHWEACSIETELFEKLLNADIQTTHRAAKGDAICKFMIKERKEGYLRIAFRLQYYDSWMTRTYHHLALYNL
jgi:predicted ArsR family transcriptional regulator